MTSDDRFYQYWGTTESYDGRSAATEVAAREAWLEATRQAYLDAITICKNEHLHDPVKENEGDISYDRAITNCVFSLQDRLKELMP